MANTISALLHSQTLGFTAAAAIICSFSAWLLVCLRRQVEVAPRRARRWWMVGTAMVAGVGVWTTHFVAMLGYRTDLVLAYHMQTTLVSGVAAIMAVGLPLAAAPTVRETWARVALGVCAGLGVGTMHLIGMAAITGCGQTQSAGFNVAAFLVGATLMGLAYGRSNLAGRSWMTAGLIVAAVCGTHFVSIAGTVLTGDLADHLVPALQTSLSAMALIGTATLLCGALLALLTAKRFERQEAAHATVLTTALHNMSNGILKISAAEVVELHNVRLCAMLNLPPDAMHRGMSLADFLQRAGDANGWNAERVARVLENHRLWMKKDCETRVDHTFDDGRILSIVCQPVADGAVMTFDDVTRAQEAQREIEKLAYHDPLTGLANRRAFMEHLAQSCAAAPMLTLLLIDLDRFKAINDTFGHGVGDQVLIGVASRLKVLAGETGFVSRLGGDEMAMVVASDVDGAWSLAEQIITDIEQPYTFSDLTVVIGCSIGICGVGDALGPDDLMQKADIALYEAKRLGRGRPVLYTAGMAEVVADRHRLESDIRSALNQGQFHLAYQPIMTLTENTIVGFEALIRWQHPTRGFVSPAEFIPLAEETGLIVPIGRWVLEEACRQAMTWPAEQHVAVNVSAVQLRSPLLLAHITAALAKSGLPAERLEIELTETALVEDGRQIALTLAALRQLGIKIAMDDFGTGYSSLAHLRDLPLDRIKIDRSFVAVALEDRHSMAVIRAITQMGRDMNIPTIAEGVEDDTQLAFLRRLGCDAVQGYLIGRPERPGAARPTEGSATPRSDAA